MNKKSFILSILFILFFVLIITTENKSNKLKINNIYNLNKVVIVGDSRMSLINEAKDSYNIPQNYIIVSKSGAQINWLEDYALNKVYRILKNTDNNYKYNVVFNLGVNDIIHHSDSNPKELAIKYFNMYLKVINYFDDVDFYFLSINPLDDNNFPNWKNNKGNEKIKKLNIYMKDLIKNSNKSNIYYCNSYGNINFKTLDGLHYTDQTNIDIINYIDKNCVRSLYNYK